MKNSISLIIILISLTAFGQVDSTDIIVEKMMKDQKITGLTLAVIKNAEVVTNKGYGLANVEHKIPVTSETVIRLGSVSKQFFTTAILKLAEEGKLSIEDSVHRFFPDAPGTWKPIRVKHLMSHTSGLQREGPAYSNNKIQPDINIIRSAYSLPLEFAAGEKYQYCNLGYFMLAEIITRLSGMPWQDYMREKLFLPAGMKHTQITDFHTIIPNRASGYMHKKDTLVNAEAMYAIRPSGGLLSTSTDMILWDKVLREKRIILSGENWELLWQPVVSTSDKPGNTNYYALGWFVDEFYGKRIVAHGGSNIGFRSYYMRFPDDGLSIIIMTNTDEANPSAIARALAAYLLPKQ